MCLPTVDVLTTMALFPEQTASKISSGLMLQLPWLTSFTCLRFVLDCPGCCTRGAGEIELETVSTLAAALRRSLLGGFNKEKRIRRDESNGRVHLIIEDQWENKCISEKTVYITGCLALACLRHLLPFCVTSKSLPESEESLSSSTLTIIKHGQKKSEWFRGHIWCHEQI